jgi:hypothetical protein
MVYCAYCAYCMHCSTAQSNDSPFIHNSMAGDASLHGIPSVLSEAWKREVLAEGGVVLDPLLDEMVELRPLESASLGACGWWGGDGCVG